MGIVIIVLFCEFFICIFDKIIGIGCAPSSAATRIQIGAPIQCARILQTNSLYFEIFRMLQLLNQQN